MNLTKRLNDLIWYVDSEIDKIDNDPRCHYKPGAKRNDPQLACVKSALESRMAVLKDVRELINKAMMNKKKLKGEDYAHYLQRKEIIGDFLDEFCKKTSYVGEIFDITPRELLEKFTVYYKKRMNN